MKTPGEKLHDTLTIGKSEWHAVPDDIKEEWEERARKFIDLMKHDPQEPLTESIHPEQITTSIE